MYNELLPLPGTHTLILISHPQKSVDELPRNMVEKYELVLCTAANMLWDFRPKCFHQCWHMAVVNGSVVFDFGNFHVVYYNISVSDLYTTVRLTFGGVLFAVDGDEGSRLITLPFKVRFDFVEKSLPIVLIFWIQ